MPTIEELIEKEVDSKKGISPEAKEDLRKRLSLVFLEGAPLNELFKLSQEQIEAVYEQGYNLYQNGKFKQAKDVFLFLSWIETHNPRSFIALGACYENEKNYTEAIKAYYEWAKRELSPLPYYHLAEVYLRLEDKESAIFALAHVILICGDSFYYHELREKAELMLSKLSK